MNMPLADEVTPLYDMDDFFLRLSSARFALPFFKSRILYASRYCRLMTTYMHAERGDGVICYTL